MTFASLLSRPGARALAVSLVAFLAIVGTAKALTTVSSTEFETDGDIIVTGDVDLGDVTGDTTFLTLDQVADEIRLESDTSIDLQSVAINVDADDWSVGDEGNATFATLSAPIITATSIASFDGWSIDGTAATLIGDINIGDDSSSQIVVGDADVGPTFTIDNILTIGLFSGDFEFFDTVLFDGEVSLGDDDADFIESQGFFFVSSNQGMEVSAGEALFDEGAQIGLGDTIQEANHTRLTNVASSSIPADSCATYASVAVNGGITTSVEAVVIATPDSDSSANGIEDNNLSWNAYASANNTVTIRACNPTAAPIDTDDDQEWDVSDITY